MDIIYYKHLFFQFYKDNNCLPEENQWAPDDIIAGKRLAIQELITSCSSHPLLQSTYYHEQ